MPHIFLISLTMSVVILGMLALLPFLRKRYSANWRYFVWLVVAIRLVIPFRLEFSGLPRVEIPIEPVVPVEISLPLEPNQPIVIDELSQQPAEHSETKKNVPLQQILFGLWALGAVSFLAYHIVSLAVFMRKIKRHCKPTNIKAALQVKTCSEISAPMLIGLFKPIILLPETNYTDKELSVVLQHELTHHKRRDLWYKLLLIVANSIHFFNPLVYLMVKEANRDLEFSCDEQVVKNQDTEFRKEYSMAILKAMKHKSRTSPLSSYLSESARGSKQRFENILNTKAKKTGAVAFVVVLVLTCVVGALVTKKEQQTNNIVENNTDSAIIQANDEAITAVSAPKNETRLIGEQSGILYFFERVPPEERIFSIDDCRLIQTKADGSDYKILEPTITNFDTAFGAILDNRIVFVGNKSLKIPDLKTNCFVSMTLDGDDHRILETMYNVMQDPQVDEGLIYYGGWANEGVFPRPVNSINADLSKHYKYRDINGYFVTRKNGVLYFLDSSRTNLLRTDGSVELSFKDKIVRHSYNKETKMWSFFGDVKQYDWSPI